MNRLLLINTRLYENELQLAKSLFPGLQLIIITFQAIEGYEKIGALRLIATAKKYNCNIIGHNILDTTLAFYFDSYVIKMNYTLIKSINGVLQITNTRNR